MCTTVLYYTRRWPRLKWSCGNAQPLAYTGHYPRIYPSLRLYPDVHIICAIFVHDFSCSKDPKLFVIERLEDSPLPPFPPPLQPLILRPAIMIGGFGQEQHRLRGIMALSEFPVDNYINPFCSVEMTPEERSAFKL